ncbi:MAG TPA: tRNA pseudouridine(38-40) synthase TruA [Candidatus Polarisedimenticolaceae bacterium]
MSRRVRIDLAYDGTDYRGWQVQPAARTVQGTLEEALSRLHGGAAVRTRGAGRTDAGVHARGQVADALVGARLDDAVLAKGLAALLPGDLRPISVATVPETFHARLSAVAKTYRYTLDRSRWGDPFTGRFTLHHPYAMDLDAAREALARLPGTRDWTGFTAAACEVEDRVRTLSEARLEVGPACVAFVFRADGFLTHMVRNLVGTILEIARGAASPALVSEVLASRDRARAGPTAPARGLCLESVEYGPTGP